VVPLRGQRGRTLTGSLAGGVKVSLSRCAGISNASYA